MGPKLAEELYRTLCNALGLSYGSDETPSYHNLDAEKRHAWDQVAARARERVQQQCLDDIRAVTVELGSVPGIEMLEERWLGKREEGR